MKILLYCTKAKPRLVYRQWTSTLNQIGIDNSFEGFLCGSEKSVGINELGECEQLNGKIVAECDFEVEEIKKKCVGIFEYCYITNTLNEFDLMNKTQLDGNSMNNYLNGKGYAIHIKNLHIFDEPRELYDCLIHPKIEPKYYGCEHLSKAPQNMMYVELDDIKYVLISIQPQWLCKILNGEKTIEVRKKVLKEMLE